MGGKNGKTCGGPAAKQTGELKHSVIGSKKILDKGSTPRSGGKNRRNYRDRSHKGRRGYQRLADAKEDWCRGKKKQGCTHQGSLTKKRRLWESMGKKGGHIAQSASSQGSWVIPLGGIVDPTVGDDGFSPD